MMMVKNNNMHLGFGLPLRWNFQGDKGKQPWGRAVTKDDLFIKGRTPPTLGKVRGSKSAKCPTWAKECNPGRAR